MRLFSAIAATGLALFGLLAVWAEFGPMAAIVDSRWAGFVLAAASGLLFGVLLRGAKGGSGRALALAGTVVTVGVMLFAVKLLFLTYREVPVTFNNGDVTLAGTLYLPKQSGTYPAITFLHGSGSQPRGEGRYHAKLFARNGFAALIYDKRGAGASSGGTWDGTYDDYALDAHAAVRFLQSHPEVAVDRIGVKGQSEGGWVAALLAGNHMPSLSFVIVTSATHLTPAEQTAYESWARVRHAGFSEDIADSARRLRARTLNYHRTGEDHDVILADLEAVSNEPWFEPAELSTRLYPFEDYAWWRSVMDFDSVPEWGKVRCPVLAISGGLDLMSDAKESQDGMQQALAAGGNTNFTGQIYPAMEHGNIEWWLPGRIPPPRFPSGYSELMVSWARAQVSGAAR